MLPPTRTLRDTLHLVDTKEVLVRSYQTNYRKRSLLSSTTDKNLFVIMVGKGDQQWCQCHLVRNLDTQILVGYVDLPKEPVASEE